VRGIVAEIIDTGTFPAARELPVREFNNDNVGRLEHKSRDPEGGR
jgi:hypothetical protein